MSPCASTPRTGMAVMVAGRLRGSGSCFDARWAAVMGTTLRWWNMPDRRLMCGTEVQCHRSRFRVPFPAFSRCRGGVAIHSQRSDGCDRDGSEAVPETRVRAMLFQVTGEDHIRVLDAADLLRWHMISAVMQDFSQSVQRNVAVANKRLHW